MAADSTLEQTALMEAWERAAKKFEEKQKTAAKAATKLPINAAIERKQTSLNALIATIRFKASIGYLDLKLPASVLVIRLGAKDAHELTTAMEYLGYVRYYKLLTPETFYRKR